MQRKNRLAQIGARAYNHLAQQRGFVPGCETGKECMLMKQFSYVLTRPLAPHAKTGGKLIK